MAENTEFDTSRGLYGIISDNRGQGLVEYALILVLIALIVIAAVGSVGSSTNNAFTSFTTEMNK